MRSALAAVAMTLAAALAAAQGQGQTWVAYQNALLARPVTPAVKSFCGGYSGAAFDACRVTRFFLADFQAGRAPGYPPMADIAYTSGQAEQNAIVAALQKYGSN